MATSYFVFIILGMFAVTFGIRFCLFAKANKVVMPNWIEGALGFVPISVLSAIIVPMIFMPDGRLDVGLDNPWLLGALAAFVIGLIKQNQLLTILVGVVVFYLSKLFI
ncbi:branched-chain amino acid transport [Marinomonas sp. S3726]|uniref:AzlD domain-containing protein n=1 Tax=Marinomonas sp. S3726 TaxID=579484 RepID=UPI0005FA1637|nr:AzlD domain-containing protein [Marinomonas sp. S3726]KJZ12440.1 branched-chain amino acid transport [Marinomonas sp. S3726]